MNQTAIYKHISILAVDPMQVILLLISLFCVEGSNNLDKYLAKRQELIDIEKRMSFSYDLEETLTSEERAADQILSRIRKTELKNDFYNVVIHDYFENFVMKSCY